jgi:hypothetical protein
MGVLSVISGFVRVLPASRTGLAGENVPLRQQFAVLQRSATPPRLRPRDRGFWVWLSRLWARWRSCLLIVKPETVSRWQRQRFKAFWRRKSRILRVANGWMQRSVVSSAIVFGRDTPPLIICRFLSRRFLPGPQQPTDHCMARVLVDAAWS